MTVIFGRADFEKIGISTKNHDFGPTFSLKITKTNLFWRPGTHLKRWGLKFPVQNSQKYGSNRSGSLFLKENSFLKNKPFQAPGPISKDGAWNVLSKTLKIMAQIGLGAYFWRKKQFWKISRFRHRDPSRILGLVESYPDPNAQALSIWTDALTTTP